MRSSLLFVFLFVVAELWALLNFLVPQLFHSAEDFGSWFEGTEDGGQRNEIVARLHRLLRPFLLRRLKIDVEKTLLPKIETKLFVGLSDMQKAWYKKILERDIEVLNATNTSKVRLLNIGQSSIRPRPSARTRTVTRMGTTTRAAGREV